MHTYLIWSTEHMAWWRPHGWGYTSDVPNAGHYTLEQANKIVEEQVHGEEIAVPYAGAYNFVAQLSPRIRFLGEAMYPNGGGDE